MLPLAKNIKRLFSFNWRLLVLLAAAAVSIGAGYGLYAWLEKDVVIYDNDDMITCKTMKSTFGEVLEENGIVVNDYDYISIPLDSELQTTKRNEIYIKRAVPVYITADNKRTTVMTYRDTVEEMFEDIPVSPGSLDRVEGADMKDKITSGMELRIVRVTENIVSETETVPYTIQRKTNRRLDKGTERVTQEGREGILEKLYKVVMEDGVEVSKQLISEKIIQNPVNKIIEIGTVMNHTTSRGDVVRYSKVLNMKATAYTASLKDTGKSPDHPLFGITATGMKARKGIVAVDPDVIPLYTKLYVEIPGDTPDYGFCIAGDVGGAIKGNKIDLYYDSQKYVDSFGVKNVKVYILNDQ